MNYNSRMYCPLPSSRLDGLKFDCFTTSKGGVAWNADKTYFLVSYVGNPDNKPHCITEDDVFTHKEMLAKQRDPADPFFQRDVD